MMNSQQVYEMWKEIAGTKSGIPRAAEKYVLGDDAEWGNIPSRVCFLWDYPKQLLDEADGEGGEMAKRCLRATAKMSYAGILSKGKAAHTKTAGFTLKDIMDDGLEHSALYAVVDYSYVAKDIYEYYKDEAEGLITPAYLKKRLTEPDEAPRTIHVAMYLAALLLKDGKGDEKQLCDVFDSYAEMVDGEVSTLFLAEVYDRDERLRKRMSDLLSESDNVYHLGRFSKENRIRKICEETGNLKCFLYTCICGRLGADLAAKAEREVLENSGEYMPWMLENAIIRCAGKQMEEIRLTGMNPSSGGFALNRASEHIDELCSLAHTLAVGMKTGDKVCGELLPEYEKCYLEMITMMTDRFYINNAAKNAAYSSRNAEIVMKAAYEDRDKAARMISFDTRATFLRMRPISAFAALYSLSEKARNILWAFIKSVEYHGNTLNYNRVSEIINECFVEWNSLGISSGEAAERLFNDGIGVNTYFMCAVASNTDTYWASSCKEGYDGISEVIKAHMDEAVAFYDEIKNDAKGAAYWAEVMLKKSGCNDAGLMLSMLKSKSKVVRKIVTEVVAAKEDEVREPLEKMLPKLKGDVLVQAQGIIKKWDNNKKYGKDFSFTTNGLAEEYVSENVNAAAVKKAAFIPEEYFADVRFADMDGKASAELVRYIISEYLVLDEPYRISVCDKLAAKLYAPDLHVCIENIYQHWLESGADNKTKMIMVPYCVYASDTQILALKKQITAWADAQRGALGAFVINAVAVNGGSTALMMVNDISNKFSSNQVKKAAKAAFSYAAKVLELPEEVLADRIVPTLGLDKNGEAVLDYGARTFTVSLMPDMSISIHDNDKDKDIKTLPKAAANDDAVKAEEAKKYVSELKKQLKAVTAAQKTRLEAVLRNGRTWTAEAWNELFVENPVMHRFASALIWGAYDNGELIATFRYSEDGTFCDENDDAYELPENAAISLVHPIELSDECISAWQEQLSDYEIVQPFSQIGASMIRLDKDDIDDKLHIRKYAGRKFMAASMNNAAKKYNFVRSTVEDAGGFSSYHIQDRVLGIGMEFVTEGMYMGQDHSDMVELSGVYIYRLPENDEVPSSYTEYEAVSPMDVSGRFISCCLGILENILD